jgi:plastocyanin
MRSLLGLILLVGFAAAVEATTFTVQIAQGGLTFSPAVQPINAGDTVHWVWAGSGHSTTSGNPCTSDGTWDSGVHNSGFTFDVTFNTPGTFPYFCSIHCFFGMTGTIIVSPPPTPTPTAAPASPTPTPGGPPPPTPTPGPSPAPSIPTLSPGLLSILGVLLAAAALFLLTRR